MSRRIKNMELVINDKIIKKTKIEKYNKFTSRKYKRYINKNALKIQKIDEIKIINIKKTSIKCKNNKVSLILIFIVFFLFLLDFEYMCKNNYNKIIFIYKKYNIGDKIEYNNKYWYVINNSKSNTDKLVLLFESKYDFNKDGILNDYDKVKFDLEQIRNILKEVYSNARVLTSKEYIEIRENMNFGYFWEDSNFLAGKNMYDWWVETNDPSKLYSITESGCFKENKKDDINFIRPVVEISKLDYK